MKILLGIQPTGRLHIGNYFGALKKGIEMQFANDTDIVDFLVANYHANSNAHTTKDFIGKLHRLGAINVEAQKPGVLELCNRLAHSTSVAELTRLPQYQTKEQTLHMLSYPLLMAADIIVSDCDAVIVGDDQEPHMHFYREVARRNGYKEAITIKSDSPRIMSIADPSKKMSKSLGDNHCIYLDDSPEDIDRKIMKAPTTPEGVENLKAISRLYGVEYDESKNQVSKKELVRTIISYSY